MSGNADPGKAVAIITAELADIDSHPEARLLAYPVDLDLAVTDILDRWLAEPERCPGGLAEFTSDSPVLGRALTRHRSGSQRHQHPQQLRAELHQSGCGRLRLIDRPRAGPRELRHRRRAQPQRERPIDPSTASSNAGGPGASAVPVKTCSISAARRSRSRRIHSALVLKPQEGSGAALAVR